MCNTNLSRSLKLAFTKNKNVFLYIFSHFNLNPRISSLSNLCNKSSQRADKKNKTCSQMQRWFQFNYTGKVLKIPASGFRGFGSQTLTLFPKGGLGVWFHSKFWIITIPDSGWLFLTIYWLDIGRRKNSKNYGGTPLRPPRKCWDLFFKKWTEYILFHFL